MKTQTESLSIQLREVILSYMGTYGDRNMPVHSPEEFLFFDIETTGLSPRNSSVYLIGAAGYENGRQVLRQWFAENLAEEEAILEAFLDFSRHFRHLIHFNGTTFDVPFLQARFRKYGLDCSFSRMEQTDIYRLVSPCKNLMKLSNCRQKSLEEFLGIHREDPFTGGQLTEVYRSYREKPDEQLLRVLLLHNADDIRGMLSILPVLAYPSLFSSAPHVRQARLAPCRDAEGNSRKELLLYLSLSYSLPVPFSFNGNGCFFTGTEGQGILKVPVFTGELKHFYPDYKNYSYLPGEDNAIHKSVAVYVDKAHRLPATPETCYTRKSGDFLPLPPEPAKKRKGNAISGSSFEPLFHLRAPSRNPAGERNDFFLPDEAFFRDPDRLSAYAARLLRSMLRS